MIIEDIAQKLAESGVGTVGVDIVIGSMPVKQSNCLSIVTSVSPVPDKSIDVYEQSVDFWVRNSSSATAYARLEQVQNLLHKAANYDTEKYHIYLSYSQGAIDDMDRDQNNRKLYKLSMSFIYRPLDVLAS